MSASPHPIILIIPMLLLVRRHVYSFYNRSILLQTHMNIKEVANNKKCKPRSKSKHDFGGKENFSRFLCEDNLQITCWNEEACVWSTKGSQKSAAKRDREKRVRIIQMCRWTRTLIKVKIQEIFMIFYFALLCKRERKCRNFLWLPQNLSSYQDYIYFIFCVAEK